MAHSAKIVGPKASEGATFLNRLYGLFRVVVGFGGVVVTVTGFWVVVGGWFWLEWCSLLRRVCSWWCCGLVFEVTGLWV